jgi:hypothetical protein
VPEEAFIGVTIKLETEDEPQDAEPDRQVKAAGARRLRREEGGDRRDAYSAPGAEQRPLRLRPDAITWAHVGTLEHYADLLKRITDSAFKEGEHAA